jgi:hypothetical protein
MELSVLDWAAQAGLLRHIAGTDRTLTLPPSVTTPPLAVEPAPVGGRRSEQNRSLDLFSFETVAPILCGQGGQWRGSLQSD